MSVQERQQKMVDHFKKFHGMDHDSAVEAMKIFEMGYESGERQGRADAQRFFRLSLGVEEPTPAEEAYWNNPVPLKERGR